MQSRGGGVAVSGGRMVADVVDLEAGRHVENFAQAVTTLIEIGEEGLFRHIYREIYLDLELALVVHIYVHQYWCASGKYLA